MEQGAPAPAPTDEPNPPPTSEEIQPEAPKERALGTSRRPLPAASGESSSDGLRYGSYVPTQREIDSGEYVVQEVIPVVRAEGVETDALEPLSNWDAAVEHVAASLFTKDWNLRFDILHSVRKLIKFQPSRIAELIADLGTSLLECLKNPRSSILREACMLSGELLTSGELMQPVTDQLSFDKLVPVLLLKSISDKKFIREAAVSALHSHAQSAPHMFGVYICSTEHKNSKVAASASHITCLCLESLCAPHAAASLSSQQFADVTGRMVRVCLHGKLAETRRSGKRCLELLEAKEGVEHLQALLAECSAPHDAEAVRRLLHPEDALENTTNSTSLAELIASSPVNSPKSSNSPSTHCSIEPVLVMEVETRARRGSTPRERRSSDEVLSSF